MTMPTSGMPTSGMPTSGMPTSGNGILATKPIIQIKSTQYYIIIFDNFIKIGCETHSISKWWDFTDKEILSMDGAVALEWWNYWKAPLQVICIAEGRE